MKTDSEPVNTNTRHDRPNRQFVCCPTKCLTMAKFELCVTVSGFSVHNTPFVCKCTFTNSKYTLLTVLGLHIYILLYIYFCSSEFFVVVVLNQIRTKSSISVIGFCCCLDSFDSWLCRRRLLLHLHLFNIRIFYRRFVNC